MQQQQQILHARLSHCYHFFRRRQRRCCCCCCCWSSGLSALECARFRSQQIVYMNNFRASKPQLLFRHCKLFASLTVYIQCVCVCLYILFCVCIFCLFASIFVTFEFYSLCVFIIIFFFTASLKTFAIQNNANEFLSTIAAYYFQYHNNFNSKVLTIFMDL